MTASLSPHGVHPNQASALRSQGRQWLPEQEGCERWCEVGEAMASTLTPGSAVKGEGRRAAARPWTRSDILVMSQEGKRLSSWRRLALSFPEAFVWTQILS